MVLKIKDLDQRYTGGDKFRYCIDFNYRDHHLFIERRNWCWETWGPSCEYKFIGKLHEPPYSWIVDSYRIRLYFRGTAEINWYKLRWE